MRRIIICLTVLTLAGIVRGQDVKPDELKKLLDQTRAELKAAQDRKAELSARVEAQAAQIDDLKRKAATFADRTLFLSAQYAAWVQFINLNPTVKMQWAIFEETVGAGTAGESPLFMDTNWPISQKQN